LPHFTVVLWVGLAPQYGSPHARLSQSRRLQSHLVHLQTSMLCKRGMRPDAEQR
jgi:hypothetical protein